jgi:ribosomal-protein-alanine N-acetyltransferase
LLKDAKGEIVGEVIGFLRNYKVPSGRVYKIGVSPDIQAKGIGSYLLKEIESRFKKAGMVRSCAEVRVGNGSSRAMFSKNNYILTSPLPGYYANGEDGVKFWKKLD